MKLKNVFQDLMWGVIACAILSMCVSCRTQYVDISDDMFIHDTTFIQKVNIDTFIQHDSVYHYECLKGDTVLVKDFVLKYIYKPKIEYRDSIVYRDKERTVVKTKVVEKTLTWWHKTLMYLGGFSVLLIGLVIYKRFRP